MQEGQGFKLGSRVFQYTWDAGARRSQVQSKVIACVKDQENRFVRT